VFGKTSATLLGHAGGGKKGSRDGCAGPELSGIIGETWKGRGGGRCWEQSVSGKNDGSARGALH